ncbi:hypothetical protein FRC12_021920 [Ceratobasidium sp. 428]|nr:hypothetical protein FRC12_021920 [Ceratobasidium sp. 428]
MRLNIAFGLVLASVALALPRHPLSETASIPALEGSKSGSEGSWYDGLVVIASTVLDRTIVSYLTGQSALTSPPGTTCAFGLSFNPHSAACELPGRFIPTPSRPDGHGKCADGQFWFGPRQTCVGEQDEIADPPVGYYCPLNWSFSAKHR